MGKLVFYGAISLDGYLAGAKDQLDWLLETDTGTSTTYEKFFETIDATAMAVRRTKKPKKCWRRRSSIQKKKIMCFPVRCRPI